MQLTNQASVEFISLKPFFIKTDIQMKNLTLQNCVFLFALIFAAALNSSAQEPTPPTQNNLPGQGMGRGSGNSRQPSDIVPNSAVTEQLKILSKPKASYTDDARNNATEGYVRVRVTFGADGQIKSVSAISGLPYGLLEQALAAARKIIFTPAKKDGVPVSVTKVVEYAFSLYFRENDELLEKNAEIIEKPEAIYPADAGSEKLTGIVKVELIFIKTGDVSVVRAVTDLPKNFETQAIEAARKIKFTPAIHKNGNPVSQQQTIEYEFKP